MLPIIKKVKLPTLTLPSAWQTVIFRNYGYVKTERIAEVLGCDTKTVISEAERLGLSDCKDAYADLFEARGYITVIRNNWYLLPYEQLVCLLGFDTDKLDFILKNDDFLDVKLGNFKPECEKIKYSLLTKEQSELTDKIAKTIKKYSSKPKSRPFDLLNDSSFSDIEHPQQPRTFLRTKHLL